MEVFTFKRAFTLVELLVTLVIFLFVSTGVYTFIKRQGASQNISSKKSSRALVSQNIHRSFSHDIARIDPSWQKFGVASIFPHPGYRYGANHYAATDTEALSDALTIIQRHDTKTTLYKVDTSLTDAPDSHFNPSGGHFSRLYAPDTWIRINQAGTNQGQIEINDWALIYQPGGYALGVISDRRINDAGEVEVLLENPNAAAQVIDSVENVLRPGVVRVGSNAVSYLMDREIVNLSAASSFLQIVRPVTYELDWLTTDGAPRASGNGYVVDENGNKQGMVYRTTYPGLSAPQRVAIGRANRLGFMYDVLAGQGYFSDTVNGYTDGDVLKNLGRKNGKGFSKNKAAKTSNIVAVKMLLDQSFEHRGKKYQLGFDQKVAIDSIFQAEQYQHDEKLFAKNSGNIHDLYGLTQDEQIGKPLFYRHQPEEQNFVILPVMSLDSQAPGKLIFMAQNGCPATEVGCDFSTVTGAGASVVTLGDGLNKFYPTSIKTLTGSHGSQIFVVGGLGMQNNTRVPMIATFTLGDKSMADMLTATNPSTVVDSLCSVPSCRLHVLDAQSNGQDIRDTSEVFINEGELWVAPMTKASPHDKGLKVYKTVLDSSTGVFTTFETVDLDPGGDASYGRVVTAVGDQPLHHGGKAYLPVCLSRSISCLTDPPATPGLGPIPAPSPGTETGVVDKEVALFKSFLRGIFSFPTCHAQSSAAVPCNVKPENDGMIMLYPMSGGAPIKIADHNYLCTTLQSVENNLLVGGKLVTQILHAATIHDVLDGVTDPPLIHTDEMISKKDNIYADGYDVAKNPFSLNKQKEKDFYTGGALQFMWNSGVNVNVFDDGSLGLALGNRMVPVTGSAIDNQHVVTMDLQPGGTATQVTSSIGTTIENVNASLVSSSLQVGQGQFTREVILPGNLIYDENTPRSKPLPIHPLFDGMTDADWEAFFVDRFDPSDRATGTAYNLDLSNWIKAECWDGEASPVSCQVK